MSAFLTPNDKSFLALHLCLMCHEHLPYSRRQKMRLILAVQCDLVSFVVCGIFSEALAAIHRSTAARAQTRGPLPKLSRAGPHAQ